MKKSYLAFVLLLLSAGIFTSCLKKEYDSPPDQSGFDPKLTVTKSIAQLLAMGTDNFQITTDEVIFGIVTADDRSGNFYKQIVIDDTTGGLTILLDANSLYNDYPVGRKIYIKCKGLYLGNYHNLPQLGSAPDNTGTLTSIPSGIIEDYVVKANYPNTVPVTMVNLADITTANTALINRLVTISEAEFAPTAAGKPYAAPAVATSLDVEDCSGNLIILRSSGYANFQPFLTPKGKGTITGIYTVYNSTPQLVIRDTSDVKFTGARCAGSIIPLLLKDFEDEKATSDGWTVQNVIGTIGWGTNTIGAQSGDAYGQCSNYSGGNHACETWLISPAIDLSATANPVLSFINACNYGGPNMEVLVSTNYDGTSAPSSAAWTTQTVTLSTGSWSWVNSGDITLPKSSKVYVAFKYTGSDSDGKTWEIDDITVSDN